MEELKWIISMSRNKDTIQNKLSTLSGKDKENYIKKLLNKRKKVLKTQLQSKIGHSISEQIPVSQIIKSIVLKQSMRTNTDLMNDISILENIISKINPSLILNIRRKSDNIKSYRNNLRHWVEKESQVLEKLLDLFEKDYIMFIIFLPHFKLNPREEYPYEHFLKRKLLYKNQFMHKNISDMKPEKIKNFMRRSAEYSKINELSELLTNYILSNTKRKSNSSSSDSKKRRLS